MGHRFVLCFSPVTWGPRAGPPTCLQFPSCDAPPLTVPSHPSPLLAFPWHPPAKWAARGWARAEAAHRHPRDLRGGTGLSARALRARPTAHLLRRSMAQRLTRCPAPYCRTAPPLWREMRRGGSRREPALSPRAAHFQRPTQWRATVPRTPAVGPGPRPDGAQQ